MRLIRPLALWSLLTLLSLPGCGGDSDEPAASAGAGGTSAQAGSGQAGSGQASGGQAGSGGAGKGGASGKGGSGKGGSGGDPLAHPFGGGGSAGECTQSPPANAQCTQDSDCGGGSNECLGYVCDRCGSWTCQFRQAENGTPCTNNFGKCGTPGQCSYGYCTAQFKQCDQSDPCKPQQCNPDTGACETQVLPDGSSCYTATCKSNETCMGGVCQGGENVCVDTPCAKAACDQYGSCQYTAITPPPSCDDGNACTEGDKCIVDFGYQAAHCEGKPKDLGCEKLDGLCIQGACDPKTGACVKKPSPQGTACDDGDACTLGETCSGYGICGQPVDFVLTPLVSTSFDDGAKGWTTSGTWAFGPAKQPPGVPFTVTQDATPGDGENAIALSTQSSGGGLPDQLVSPTLDASQIDGPLWLTYFSQLYGSSNGQTPIFSLDVWDGSAWQPLFITYYGYDSQWTRQRFELTKYKNPQLRVRFVHASSGNFGNPYNAMALDQVVIGTPATGCSSGGAGGAGGAGGQGGASGQGAGAGAAGASGEAGSSGNQGGQAGAGAEGGSSGNQGGQAGEASAQGQGGAGG